AKVSFLYAGGFFNSEVYRTRLLEDMMPLLRSPLCVKSIVCECASWLQEGGMASNPARWAVRPARRRARCEWVEAPAVLAAFISRGIKGPVVRVVSAAP